YASFSYVILLRLNRRLQTESTAPLLTWVALALFTAEAWPTGPAQATQRRLTHRRHVHARR
ncbi:MAG: hypothetical protein MZW92_07445, partial [Comamonadaceae bacterium]|nr:hypothetical protein [Comamonadaceae bacterium]